MSKQGLTASSIPMVLLACVFASSNAAGLITVVGLAAFAKAVTASVRHRTPGWRRHTIVVAILAFLISVYFVWGGFVLTGNPHVWPRQLPFPDKAVLAIHDAINPQSEMPFDNIRTLSVVGATVLLSMAIAGWNLGTFLRGTTMQKSVLAGNRYYYFYLRTFAGSAIGLCLGMAAALTTYSKRSPLPVLLILLGTFAGAWVGYGR